MAFPSHFLDEIRARVPLADLIGRKVRLVRHGREWSGLCPFHNEKTPSFTVNQDKGFFHCFGCQAHGSHFDFVMRTEGVGFPEAVERLAGEAGLPMPARSPDADRREKARASLLDVMTAAAGWFADALRSPDGAEARRYLAGRGLSEDTVRTFGLGFAPERRTALKQALLGRGIEEAQLVEAGLVIRPDDGGATYDRFRNRVMFPIADRRGRVIAFGGRALGEARAKYLNSPETPLFHKGHTLYNLSRARAAVQDAGTVIVAEGYMDVIALHDAGFGNAVAPLGTAVTEEQLQELWRVAAEPVLCFDGDAAGWNAALRAAERALPLLRPGHSLRFAVLPPGEDPDTLVRTRGAGAMRTVLDDALALSEVLWRSLARAPLDTPERHAGFARALRDLAGRIADPDVRTYYLRHFDARLEAAFPTARRGTEGRGARAGGTFRPQAGGRSRPRGGLAERRIPRSHGLGAREGGTTEYRERVLVATVLAHPDLLDRVIEEFAAVVFTNPKLDRLRSEIIEMAAGRAGLDSATLKGHLNDRGYSAILERIADDPVVAPLSFVKPGVTLEVAEAGWRRTFDMHRVAGSLSEERRGIVESYDLSEEGFDRFIALLSENERDHATGTAMTADSITSTEN